MTFVCFERGATDAFMKIGVFRRSGRVVGHASFPFRDFSRRVELQVWGFFDYWGFRVGLGGVRWRLPCGPLLSSPSALPCFPCGVRPCGATLFLLGLSGASGPPLSLACVPSWGIPRLLPPPSLANLAACTTVGAWLILRFLLLPPSSSRGERGRAGVEGSSRSPGQ